MGRDSAVYRLVLSVIEIPAHLLPGNMDMKKLIFACDAILTGGIGDHQQSVYKCLWRSAVFTAAGRFFVLLKRKTTGCPLDKRRSLCYPFVT